MLLDVNVFELESWMFNWTENPMFFVVVNIASGPKVGYSLPCHLQQRFFFLKVTFFYVHNVAELIFCLVLLLSNI